MQIIKLHGEKHKYMAIFSDGKKQKFGFSGMNDYIITGDKDARERYKNRHRKDLDTDDPRRAGYLSFYLLWNKPTLEESIKDYKKRFGKYL
jgi:hypothetical protein